eukprot:4136097-Pyramimonas_sp.AAC.1
MNKAKGLMTATHDVRFFTKPREFFDASSAISRGNLPNFQTVQKRLTFPRGATGETSGDMQHSPASAARFRRQSAYSSRERRVESGLRALRAARPGATLP